MLTDEKYMHRCIELAQLGLGNVAPNPMVGCVIVHRDKIIGEGYHRECGQAHAEVNAIRSVKDKSLLSRAVLYVNLEPCAHSGKTPPCSDLIISHNISKVVISNVDSNPLVGGKGIKKLMDAGIQVKTGILEKEARELNKRFFTFHEKKRPFIILKWAQTKDGFFAGKNRKDNWITNELSRKLVHKWRSEEQAIMAGTNTALIDNPKLDVRLWKGKNPLRIVIDKDLRLPPSLHLFDRKIPAIVFNSEKDEQKKNLEFIKIDFEKDIVPQIINLWYSRDIQSVMIEGGAKLLNTFIQKGLWDEARVFTGNKFFREGIAAPFIAAEPAGKESIGEDELYFYKNPHS